MPAELFALLWAGNEHVDLCGTRDANTANRGKNTSKEIEISRSVLFLWRVTILFVVAENSIEFLISRCRLRVALPYSASSCHRRCYRLLIMHKMVIVFRFPSKRKFGKWEKGEIASFGCRDGTKQMGQDYPSFWICRAIRNEVRIYSTACERKLQSLLKVQMQTNIFFHFTLALILLSKAYVGIKATV